jgi:hypothetical protein
VGLLAPWSILDFEAFNLALVRGLRLQVALALYRSREGRLPATLQDLVPRYLPDVPADPFTGRSFRYRISAGEWHPLPPDLWGKPRKQRVPAGQGIVWSVGLDCRDDGGKTQGSDRAWLPWREWENLGADLLFFVPAKSER